MRISFLLCSLLVVPAFVYAQELNIGFVQGLWYSSEPVFVGVPTRVYVAFRNNTESDLTGTVVFMDNGKRIGSSYVNVLSGRIAEAWVDWTPTSGDHTLSVALNNAEIHPVGKEAEKIDAANIATEDAVVVDHDTDGDRVGNLEDPDDDNDGVTDVDEKTRGSNPLVANAKPTELVKLAEQTDAPAALPATATSTEEGLERFLPEGVTDTVLSNISDAVQDSKRSIDAYREERNKRLYAGEATGTQKLQIRSATSSDNATITRSRIEKEGGFVAALIGGVNSILKNLYTFVLWVLSKLLSSPALIELLLLLGILYFIYRVARRIGRRPTYY